MAMSSSRAMIRGSERRLVYDASVAGPVPKDERFEVTVRVRRKTPLKKLAAAACYADQALKSRRYLTREEYASEHSADAADLAKVENFARGYGLTVVETSPARRSVFLSGTVAQFEAAFGTTIKEYKYHGGTYRGRTGSLTMPSDLADIVEGVFGIDDRPAARPHFQRYKPGYSIGIQARATGGAFTPPELARLYAFPSDMDGSGQCMAIIELGGGFRTDDLNTYFQKLGLPAPNVTAVRVDGANNQPSGPDGPDGEVMLDIEVAASIAPKALVAVYFAPNTDKGFLDAITMAIHDTANKPSVISISWGSAEDRWTEQAMTSFDQAFQTAAALGITICCAAGDNGSSDGEADGNAHVDFPASSPFVLGCGGTRLVASGNAISSEQVWNDGPGSATGGGVSGFFPLPTYQSQAGVPRSKNPVGYEGRGVPDVAGDADPATGYLVRVDGQDTVIGGTSAVAPLWSGLVALLNQKLGHSVGFLNPLIYGPLVSKNSFRNITSGNNGAYAAGQGWNACAGLGTPIGVNLLQALENDG
jgi:kumamolisin